jgi:acylpyruvate hydrolase
MKLATVRTPIGTVAVRVDEVRLVETGHTDVGELLARPGWQEIAASASGAEHALDGAEFAPLVPRPGKVVCVGLNYRNHILEMGRELPEFPTLFTKYAESLIGATDDIALAPESDAVDWEAELAVVVGATVRRARGAEAEAAIAGFAVLNDVTMRDWQYRTPMWDQGKTWESTTPLGPFLVTPDELPGGVRPVLDLAGYVDGERVQHASTGDLVFDPVHLVEYVSTIVTLRPGDIIASGTPGGVGHARRPPRYLSDGTVLITEIQHLGRTENRAVAEVVA